MYTVVYLALVGSMGLDRAEAFRYFRSRLPKTIEIHLAGHHALSGKIAFDQLESIG
jgi:hypothetical protein